MDFGFAVYNDSSGGALVARIESTGRDQTAIVHSFLLNHGPALGSDTRIVFESPVSFDQRQAFLEAVLRGLVETPLGDSDNEEDPISFETGYFDVPQSITSKGYDLVDCGMHGDRVEVDIEFEPSFALQLEGEDYYLVGYWETVRCLRIHQFATCWEGASLASIECTHGHPDSMTSGVWGNSFYLLSEHLGVAVYNNDDDGDYTKFQMVNALSSADKASTLDLAVRAWGDFDGAEANLLSAYFGRFRRGVTDRLGSNNPGYRVESLKLVAPADVLDELRRLNPPLPRT